MKTVWLSKLQKVGNSWHKTFRGNPAPWPAPKSAKNEYANKELVILPNAETGEREVYYVEWDREGNQRKAPFRSIPFDITEVATRDRPLIDLGAGPDPTGFILATQMGSSVYIGVEPFHLANLQASIKSMAPEIQETLRKPTLPECLLSGEHANQFLSRIQEAKQDTNFLIRAPRFASGEYAQELSEHLSKVLGERGVLFLLNQKHEKAMNDGARELLQGLLQEELSVGIREIAAMPSTRVTSINQLFIVSRALPRVWYDDPVVLQKDSSSEEPALELRSFERRN